MESERESDGSQTGIKVKSRWESDEDWTEIEQESNSNQTRIKQESDGN